jgi:sulfoxide reductase heme-binding subunit YedZ
MLRKGYEQLSKLLNTIANWKYFKPAVFIGCAVPFALLVLKVLASENLPWYVPSLKDIVESTIGGLGVDVTKALLHETGEDSLGLLLACLAITPIRRIFKVNGIQKVRKLVGVWSFVYAVVHVTLYVGLDQACFDFASCDGGLIVQDIFNRPFIFVGMVAFVCLTLLAITSPTAAVRLLKKNWQRLHRLVYLAGIAGVIHFVWIQKADYEEPLMWAGWLALFLAIRVYFAIQKRRKASAKA